MQASNESWKVQAILERWATFAATQCSRERPNGPDLGSVEQHGECLTKMEGTDYAIPTCAT
jgi:hypothetical protein